MKTLFRLSSITMIDPHDLNIRYIKNPLEEELAELHKMSREEGDRLLEKLFYEFKTGTDSFNQKGECLLVGEMDEKIVAIGGLTIDPLNPERGRIRRLYVLPSYRGKGIGKKLVQELLRHSKRYFPFVSVNIGQRKIAEFYEKLGFQRYDQEEGITHLLVHRN